MFIGLDIYTQIALILVIIGGICLGLLGLFNFALLGVILGSLARIIYIIIGIAAGWLCYKIYVEKTKKI